MLGKFEKLESIDSDRTYITRKKPFRPIGNINEYYVSEAYDFAYMMTFGGIGEHRDHRSGGTIHRTNSDIFMDTFLGKLGEYAFYQYVGSDERYKDGVIVSPPNNDINPAGIWDNGDFTILSKRKGNKKFTASVKTSKSFANVLFLECNDYDDEGHWKNGKNDNCCEDDSDCELIFMTRVAPYANGGKFEIQRSADAPEKSLITGVQWKFDIPGYITRTDLKYLIANGFVIEKGKILNGTTMMDASNYYCQAGCLRSF